LSSERRYSIRQGACSEWGMESMMPPERKIYNRAAKPGRQNQNDE
jgi:hypothetical protein